MSLTEQIETAPPAEQADTGTGTAAVVAALPGIREAASSQAGPAAQDDGAASLPPLLRMPRTLQQVRFAFRQGPFLMRAQRQLGEVFRMCGVLADDWVTLTSHPDHIRSLFTAPADQAPSLTGESPLRPIVGPNSVLTLLGPKHMRQRKLLLPSFHGEAVERYVAMISHAAEREIDRWPVGEPFPLAPRMQAITLDVIMAGIFGVEGLPERGTPERELREEIRRIVGFSTRTFAQVAELALSRRRQRGQVVTGVMGQMDSLIYALIDQRRRERTQRTDILSLLLAATDEDGQPMSDEELRDELITLVLAGHETTANSLAWAFERLLRTPAAYDRLRELARGGGAGSRQEADDYIEACIHEAMRARPVIPMVGRRVQLPWRLGSHTVPAGSGVVISILLLHHRHDVYPQPFAFWPERFMGVKPGTYTWIPFGGGIRRCLGATLAMAEQRVVMEAVARRLDMVAPDPAPERMRHRNVTMIPERGALTRILARR